MALTKSARATRDSVSSPFATRHSSLAIPRVACFTPLSPVESGISFYSEELLPVLARALDLDVFVDGYRPTHADALDMVRLRDAREFERAARARPYDAVIYQLGNSPAHAYMYDRALRHPGVVVLHDVVLHHLRLWMAVNRGRRREYAAAMERLYGARGREVARLVLRGQTPPALFDYPLVEPVLDAAPAVIVHNRASAERVRALRPTAAVHVVPMGVPLPQLPPRDEARARLGVPPDAFLVISLGHVNPYKRLDVALRAFGRLLVARPDARFLVAGSEASGSRQRLERQIGYLGLSHRVRALGFVPPATVADLLAAADCCVNLRYPSAGETSASLLRILGAGLPVLVSDAGSFRELPDDCCVKLPVGGVEEPLLAECLVELARNEPLRAGLGARARRFVAAEHSLERSAAGYLDVLGALIGRPLHLPESAPPAPSNPGGERTVALMTLPATGNGGAPQGPPSSSPPGLGRGAHPRDRHAPSSVAVTETEATGPEPDPLLDGVGEALAELRLAGHEPTERTVARDLVELGLGPAGSGSAVPVGIGRRVWRRIRARGTRR